MTSLYDKLICAELLCKYNMLINGAVMFMPSLYAFAEYCCVVPTFVAASIFIYACSKQCFTTCLYMGAFRLADSDGADTVPVLLPAAFLVVSTRSASRSVAYCSWA